MGCTSLNTPHCKADYSTGSHTVGQMKSKVGTGPKPLQPFGGQSGFTGNGVIFRKQKLEMQEVFDATLLRIRFSGKQGVTKHLTTEDFMVDWKKGIGL